MLNVRYDPESRSGFVRLREGRTARTRQLSTQATAEYGRRGELLAITLTDVDPTAAEFLRTADEDSLLAVIRAQTGKAVWTTPQGGPPRPKPAAAKSGAGSGQARRKKPR
ncbi:MAG TPA: DUF2283 domain-containing protein [Gaiellales bacterium]|jgi:hypothetical protein|nr:DUF2283 domain-containing protein [Gaiellales bacterium]